MEELIGRLVANVGVDRTAAATAVGIILQFLVKEGPADKVQTLIDKLPGAGAAIKAAPPDANSAGMFGGGLMAAGSRMMAAGLSMSEVQAVTRRTQSAKSSARFPVSGSSSKARRRADDRRGSGGEFYVLPDHPHRRAR